MTELGKRYKASKGGGDGLDVEDETDVCEDLPLSGLRLSDAD